MAWGEVRSYLRADGGTGKPFVRLPHLEPHHNAHHARHTFPALYGCSGGSIALSRGRTTTARSPSGELGESSEPLRSHLCQPPWLPCLRAGCKENGEVGRWGRIERVDTVHRRDLAMKLERSKLAIRLCVQLRRLLPANYVEEVHCIPIVHVHKRGNSQNLLHTETCVSPISYTKSYNCLAPNNKHLSPISEPTCAGS